MTNDGAHTMTSQNTRHANGPSAEVDQQADTGQPVVMVTNVVKHFTRTDGTVVTAVDDVSLEVQPGEFVVLLGPSGCGKTTLLRTIAGLEQPDSGTIQIHGETMFSSQADVNQPPQRRRLSMIFQSYALWPHMTAFQNVAYPLRARHAPRGAIADRVNQTLEMVGIPELAGQYPANMSGGQQQRVALARTLVSGDRLVLFDEPLSNVDAKVREELRVELVTMQRELGFSALYVTHDQVEAMQLAHRIAVMNRGRIEQLGPPLSVYTEPRTRYVANFVGSVNELAGTVIAASTDGSLDVKTDIGVVKAVIGNEDVREGSSVILLFRPERCAIDDGTTSRENTWEGEVEAAMFSGSHTEYVVCIDDDIRFNVWRSGLDLLTVGQRVTVHVDASHVRAVPAS